MEQNQDSESGRRATLLTVARLVLEVSDGLLRVNNALLELSEYKAFAHQKDCLHEDAEQLRELRGDMLDYILETWRNVETSEADELRVNRKVRGKLARETDKASIPSQGTIIAANRDRYSCPRCTFSPTTLTLWCLAARNADP